MPRRNFAAGAAVALGVMLSAARGLSQSHPPTEGPAVDGSPGWFLQGSFPDPTGRTIVEPDGRVTIPPRGGGPGAAVNAAIPLPVSVGPETPPW